MLLFFSQLFPDVFPYHLLLSRVKLMPVFLFPGEFVDLIPVMFFYLLKGPSRAAREHG